MNKLYSELSQQSFLYRIYSVFFINLNLGLMEQRVWNIMFFFAHDKLLTAEYHKISFATLLNSLAIKDQAAIRKAVINMKKLVNYERNNTKLFFDDIQITQNAVIYKYPDFIRLFSNKIMFDVSQRMINVSLSSKYSLAFYYFCLHWNLLGYLTTVSIAALKHFFNIETTRYNNPKILMNSILIPSIYEINENTPLSINLRPIKDKHNIVAFTLDVKNKVPFEVADAELADFVLHCFAFLKAFFLYNEHVEVGKFCVDRYISLAEREFMHKLIPEAKARQRSDDV
ncbi:MAG: replication protein [candidate division TM6 bacterium GW2011_GWF2_37_49]|nr:MAG: replication protein [candidate division TM6 bacterium GW2011_GWF2_37_49]